MRRSRSCAPLKCRPRGDHARRDPEGPRKLPARGVDFGLLLYLPHCAFDSTESLRASFEQLEHDQLDSVFPVVAFDYPIQRATRINAAGCLELIDAGHRFSRSQDLEPAYHGAGQFYTFRTDALLKTGDIWTEKTGAVVLNPMQVQDIDTEDDWAVAELKFERIHDP